MAAVGGEAGLGLTTQSPGAPPGSGGRRFLGLHQTRALLERHRLAPHRALGQNFVIDPNTVRKVVRDAGVGAGDLVCEVGAGLGSLTLALREAGARVVAVEIDSGMVRALAEVVGQDPLIRVVHADALTLDFAAVLDGRARLVANLPYNVATHVVMRALDAGVFDRLLVMVQKEVGRRWAAVPGDALFSGISVKLGALADVRVVAPVSRNAFYPVPNVDSVTVELVPRGWTCDADRDVVFALVDGGFAQRRKRLRNALVHAGWEGAQVDSALAEGGLDPNVRAEALDVGDWAALARRLAPGAG